MSGIPIVGRPSGVQVAMPVHLVPAWINGAIKAHFTETPCAGPIHPLADARGFLAAARCESCNQTFDFKVVLVARPLVEPAS